MLLEKLTTFFYQCFPDMKLFALLVMYKDDPPTRLKGAFDVSSFSFFQRSSVQGDLLKVDFSLCFLKIIISRTRGKSLLESWVTIFLLD